MPTFTALTTLAGKFKAEALGEALETLEPAPYGVGVFELEDGSGLWEVGGYFLDAPNDIALALLSAAHGAKPFAVSELPDTDWVAHVRRELHPVEAGRFFVYGAHDADKLPEERIGLLIEAAMAFGTGHHGTTHGCLNAFDRLLDEGLVPCKVADIGCGTAVLAMAAAKAWHGQMEGLGPVFASDIDQVAVDVAEVNTFANDVSKEVTCLQAAGFESETLKQAGPFGLVFANILKGPLIELAPSVSENTAKEGCVILSGLLNEQADDVIAAYANVGLSLKTHDIMGEWSILTLIKQ